MSRYSGSMGVYDYTEELQAIAQELKKIRRLKAIELSGNQLEFTESRRADIVEMTEE